MKKFSILPFFLLAVLFAAPPAFAQAGADCPVMPGNKTKEKFFTLYEGRKVHFCCLDCLRAFKKHPEKYAAALPKG